MALEFLRPLKNLSRSYSCSVALSDPNGVWAASGVGLMFRDSRARLAICVAVKEFRLSFHIGISKLEGFLIPLT